MTEYKIDVVLSLSIFYAYTTLSCHSVGIVELCHPVLAAVTLCHIEDKLQQNFTVTTKIGIITATFHRCHFGHIHS